jgi:iron uptake system component EfeO
VPDVSPHASALKSNCLKNEIQAATVKLPRPIRSTPKVIGFACALLFGAAAVASVSTVNDSSRLDVAAAEFKPYLLDRVTLCLAAVIRMRDRVAAHDLAAAQEAWLAARSGWEGSEVITNEFFPNLDREIDAWPDARTGFHSIEARLFGAHDIRVLPAAEQLVANLTDFKRQLQAVHLTAQGLLNGSARLLFEIGESKAEGGESPFSGNSLSEMRNNIDSVDQAFQRVFASAAGKRNPTLAKQFAADLKTMREVLSVPTLQDLDQARLRDLSETLVSDLVEVGRACGLESPPLGN